MREQEKILAIIPARGGSKGLPGKNIMPLCGKPLLAWSIEAAQKAGCVNEVVLSTDAYDIAGVGQKWGCKVHMRPAELATDSAGSVDVVLDVLRHYGENFSHFVLLQPTSPLREARDIDACFLLANKRNAPCCISVNQVSQHPYLCFKLDHNDILHNIYGPDATLPSRRQDYPEAFSPNGAVYMTEIEWFQNNRTFVSGQTIGYIMPGERSVDIDDLFDFQVAEFIMNKKIGNAEKNKS